MLQLKRGTHCEKLTEKVMLLEYHRNLLAPLQQTVKTNLINDIPTLSSTELHAFF